MADQNPDQLLTNLIKAQFGETVDIQVGLLSSAEPVAHAEAVNQTVCQPTALMYWSSQIETTIFEVNKALLSGEKKQIMPKLTNLNGKVLAPVVYLLANSLSSFDLKLFVAMAPTVVCVFRNWKRLIHSEKMDNPRNSSIREC